MGKVVCEGPDIILISLSMLRNNKGVHEKQSNVTLTLACRSIRNSHGVENDVVVQEDKTFSL